MHAANHLVLSEGLSNFEGSHGVPEEHRRSIDCLLQTGEIRLHVGSHDGNTNEGVLAVLEGEGTLQVYLAARLQSRPLWADQHVLEIQLDVVFNARHDDIR